MASLWGPWLSPGLPGPVLSGTWDTGASCSLTPEEEAAGPRGGAVAPGKQELRVGLWRAPCPPWAPRLPVSLQLWGGV